MLPYHTCTTALLDAPKCLLCWQVVDFWAFSTEEWGKEIMSMHHTRNALQKMTPQVCQEAATRLHPSSTAIATATCTSFLNIISGNAFAAFQYC